MGGFYRWKDETIEANDLRVSIGVSRNRLAYTIIIEKRLAVLFDNYTEFADSAEGSISPGREN